MTIAEVFILTGSIQGIIFSTLLFIKLRKDNSKQNFWLALFILSFSLVLIKGWYIGSELYLKAPFFLFFPMYFSLGIGPTFYLYVKYLIKKDYTFKSIELLHFILPIVQFVYHSINFLKPISERLDYFHTEYLVTFLPIEELIGILSLCTYYFLSYKVLRKYQISQKGVSLGVPQKVLYKWVNHFIFFSYSMLLFWTLTFFVDYFIYDYSKTYSFYYPVYLWMVFILYWIIYRGFISTSKIQPEIIDSLTKSSYSLPEKDSDNYIQILIRIMEEDKIYLKPKLTLVELAEIIDINSKYLSQIINKNFNKSYTEYINTYRIEFAKKELLSIQNTNLTISAISENCGFNSKSTFNDVFKKVTNQTPTLFIKNNS
jgi:AraC-like DNA-binding protein